MHASMYTCTHMHTHTYIHTHARMEMQEVSLTVNLKLATPPSIEAKVAW